MQIYARVGARRHSGERWRRSGTRSRRRRRRRCTTAIAIAVVAVALSAIGSERRDRASIEPGDREAPAHAAAIEPAADLPARPVFRYSVIPGGAYSAAELTAAIAGDSVIARHYAGLDPRRARVIRLAQRRVAFVSYRLGDRVFWTKSRVVIPAGEPVLTDGVFMARARCGNQISDVAGATSPSEPPAGSMETPTGAPLPLVPVGLATSLGAYQPPPERTPPPAGMILVPPGVYSAVVLPPGIQTPRDPEVPVKRAPEPAAIWLLVIGATALGYVNRRIRGCRAQRHSAGFPA